MNPQQKIRPIVVHGRLLCDVKINGAKQNVIDNKYKNKYWGEGPEDALIKVVKATQVSSFEITFVS